MKGKKPLSLVLIAAFILSSVAIPGVSAVPEYTPPPPIGLWADDYTVETKDNLTGTRFNITVNLYEVINLGAIKFTLWYNTTLLDAVYTYLTPMSEDYLKGYGPLDPDTMEYTPTSPIFDTEGFIYWYAIVKAFTNPFNGSAPVLTIEFEITLAPPYEPAPPDFITYSCPLHLNETVVGWIDPVDFYEGKYVLDTDYGLADGLYEYKRLQKVIGAPVADFTWSPLYPSECTTVSLHDTSFPGEEATLVSWSWTVTNGTGEAVLTGPPDAQDTTMHGVTAGIVSVTLNVTNDYGKWDTVTKDIEILAVAGAIIDLYTSPNRFCGQETDYIGEGPGVECDALSPDVNVTLYAKVTWNGAPVMHIMVSFEIRWMQYIEWEIPGFEPVPKDEFVLSRTVETDEDGIARTWFRVPIPSSGPQMFGKWLAIATCKVQGEQIGDTMPFDVGRLITILEGGVFTTEPEYVRDVDVMTIHIKGKNIAWMDKSVTFVVTVCDDGDVPIGQKIADVTISGGEFCSPLSFEIILYDAIHVPQHAYVGIGKVYVSAFTALPSECGVPYCPEKSDTFLIKF